jgi:hypothetical protein
VRLGLRRQHPPQNVILSLLIGFCHESPIARRGPEMNKFAVYHARDRLKRAREEAQHLRRLKSMDDARRHWFDFLQAANGVFVKLEKGAQNYPKSRGWWDRLKHRRKKDELLAYLHHARRVEEHGLNFSTELGAPHIELVADDYVIPEDRRGKEVILNLGPRMKRIKTTLPAGLQLVDVVDDQYGDVFPVPTTHLGKPLTELLPEWSVAALAELAISTMEQIIDEAAQLVPEGQHMSSPDKQTQSRG